MIQQLWFDKPYARVRRLGPSDNVFIEKSGLEVHRAGPAHVLVQWRIKSKAGKPGSGTIAQGSLPKAEILALRDYLTEVSKELVE